MNFMQNMQQIIKENNVQGLKPRLLLHSCCAPCSSSVIELLNENFKLTVLYYNPNIYPYNEYLRRAKEQQRFISEVYKGEIGIAELYEGEQSFLNMAKGFENEKEGAKRCEKCFILRLNETAKLAKACNYDFFCTTLTVSPHKNAALINEIGETMQEKYGTKFLPSDFKKKNGFKRSMELSKVHNLYKQNYCGCVFSYVCKENES